MKQSKWMALLFLCAFAGLVACKNEDKEKDSTTVTEKKDNTQAQNIEKARAFYPLFAKGDWAAIEQIIDPSFKDHGPMIPEGANTNRDSLMHYLKMTKEGFPDLNFEVLHTAADGDMVFVHYRFAGTNSGTFMGMPATNKKIEYTGVDLLKIKEGKAIEHWDYADNVTYMKQMGMMEQ